MQRGMYDEACCVTEAGEVHEGELRWMQGSTSHGPEDTQTVMPRETPPRCCPAGCKAVDPPCQNPEGVAACAPRTSWVAPRVLPSYPKAPAASIAVSVVAALAPTCVPARSDPAGPPPSVGNGFALMCWRRLDVFCGLLAALPPVGHQSSCTADGACSAVVSLPDWLMGWGAIMQPTHLLTQPRKDMSPMQPMLC